MNEVKWKGGRGRHGVTWKAYIETDGDPEWYVGTVWEDGSATFGKERAPKHFGSIYLAAQALDFYVKAGGR
jgi:hypothetical protein